jgi:C4-dicarboxylate transporter DctM subunit
LFPVSPESDDLGVADSGGSKSVITAIIILLILFSLMGLPVFAGIMAAAMLGLHSSGVDFSAIAIEIFRLANAPVLLAIPLFTFAGYLLSEGKTSERLVRFSRSLFGWLPGGLGVVVLVSCSFFTAITGATGVTIIALGGLLLPALLTEKYREEFSLGLITASGSLGLLFPPSLPIILYGFVSGVSIEKLFAAGLIPGTLTVASLCLYSILMGKKWRLDTPAFSFAEFVQALKGAAWELPIPFLILAALYSGFCTATETAALTVVYVLIIKTLLFHELRLLHDVPRIMVESMKMVGGIMIVLGAALGFTNYLVDAFVPMKIFEFLQGIIESKLVFLLVLNLFLLVVGCMMDIFSAILVVVPLITPLAEKFHVDPVHLGVIFLANLGIGYITPPIGLSLFIASSRFDRPIMTLFRATLPFCLILLLTMALITYWPSLSLFLLRWVT